MAMLLVTSVFCDGRALWPCNLNAVIDYLRLNDGQCQLPICPDAGHPITFTAHSTAGSDATRAVTLTVSQATYYVDFVSGADTNSGISKDAPWQYAPGMSSCAFNCALITLQPGGQIIFKGGVTWDASGFPMGVSASADQYGPYTRLNSIPITTTQYIDLTVQLGTHYLYWVTAVDPDTLQSPFSDSAPACIPPSSSASACTPIP